MGLARAGVGAHHTCRRVVAKLRWQIHLQTTNYTGADGRHASTRQTVHALKSVKRYEVRWANLDPTTGAEMAKTRPVVIVSLNALNDRLQTITVCPLTVQLHPTWRSRLAVRVARKSADVAVDQIRTISKARLGERLGMLTAAQAD